MFSNQWQEKYNNEKLRLLVLLMKGGASYWKYKMFVIQYTLQ